MNQLTTIEKTALDKLPLNLQEFVKLRLEKPVKELNDFELKKNCLDLISVSYAEQAQYNIDPKILAHQRDCLFDELRTQTLFKGLTWSEVQKSFKMGIRGESGAFFGMCSKTYHQFLKFYAEKPERANGMRQYLDLVNSPKVAEKPLYIKKQESDQGCINAFNHYKETKQMPYTSFAIYSILKEKGLFNWTHEEKIEMAKEAEAKYVQRLKDDKLSRKINTFQYEELIANLSNNKTLFNLKQEVALRRYFDKLLSEGSELKV